MILLHQIGARINSNFNEIGEILLCNDTHLSFDGIYESVYKNYKKLLGKRITFFVMGSFVGGDNKFDVMQPLSNYCTWEQVREMAEFLDADIGFHSWTHRDLTMLSDAEVREEVMPPDGPGTMKTFAYPFGAVNKRVAAIVEAAGYEKAYSVFQGDNSDFQLNRKYLNW